MSNKSGLVSVIIPAHRDDCFLDQAIESILGQTYGNIEILLLDNSINGINETKFINSPVQTIRTNPSWNLSKVLNLGIASASGKFLARMDSDDISFPDRIEQQVNVLENHQEIGVLGSAVEILSETTEGKWAKGNVFTQPTSNEEICKMMFSKNPFFHPTIMLRRSILPRNPYNEGYVRAQDYRLWVRLYGRTKFANLVQPLVKYRFHSLQVGNTEQEISKAFAERARFALGVKTFVTYDSNLKLGYEAAGRYLRIRASKMGWG